MSRFTMRRSLDRSPRLRLIGLTSTVAALALVVSACGSSSEPEETGTEPGATPEPSETADGDQANDVRMAVSSAPWPGGVNTMVSPFLFANDFGLNMDMDKMEVFGSGTTARQVMVSGGLDVTSGSFVGGILMIESGQDVKYICPATIGYTALILGTGDVETVQDIDPETTKIAVEPPGGPSNLFMDLVFRSNGVDFRTNTLSNTVVIDDTPQRLSALIRGDAEVAIVDAEMLPQVQEALGEDGIHVLSNVMEDVGGELTFNGFLAPTEWIDANKDLAASLCATILKGNGALMDDFELFKDVNDEVQDSQYPEDELKEIWDNTVKYAIFPDSIDGLSEDRVRAVIDASIENGVLKEESRSMKYEDVVAVDVLEKAQELLDADDTGTDNPVY